MAARTSAKAATGSAAATAAAAPAGATAFAGWPRELYEFYDGLDEDNSREYFHAHKAMYDNAVRGPMERLLARAEKEFGTAHIFRPNRDTRFAKDKRPYKDACGAVIESAGKAVYYVQVNGSGIMAASGYYMMQSDQIARYRVAVAADEPGEELAAIVTALRAAKCTVGSEDLKRVPPPYPQDHPRAALLRYKSITTGKTWEQPTWLHTPAAATHVFAVWRRAAALNAWLDRHVGSSTMARPGR